jgi:sugar phosphate isomerase/epimerase
MKIAIDSYCYHRYFGEVYAGLEADPGMSMTIDDFIERARMHRVDGVSLESFMLTDRSAEHLARLRNQLKRGGLECVWAWGHPRGLESGLAPQVLNDLLRHIDIAHAVGASVMRICAGGRATRTLSWQEHKTLLLPLLRQAADYAARHNIELAIENHIDFLADELLELLETLDHPALGVCLDTANNLRMLENPSDAIAKLAPYAKAVHLKDVTAFKGSPRDFGFWPSVPVGRGLIDIPFALSELRKANFAGLLAIEIDYLHPDFGSEDSAITKSVAYVKEYLAAELASKTIKENA